MNPARNELLEHIYSCFNARHIEEVLVVLHPDVDWPNGMEGGRVLGRDAVRDYWTRQFTLIHPQVEPRAFHVEPDGRVAVDVHQVVRDLEGKLLDDRMVQHVYRIDGAGLIVDMEIR